MDVDFLSIENETNLNIHFNLKEKDSNHIDLEIIGSDNKSIIWKIEFSINYFNY